MADGSAGVGSGTASGAQPIKKCPGVTTLVSEGSSCKGPMGLEFRQAST